MSTIIRDFNGNRVKKTLRHYTNHAVNTGPWHKDSTGLYCVDYTDDKGRGFCAFIRPETPSEHNAIRLAETIGTHRP